MRVVGQCLLRCFVTCLMTVLTPTTGADASRVIDVHRRKAALIVTRFQNARCWRHAPRKRCHRCRTSPSDRCRKDVSDWAPWIAPRARCNLRFASEIAIDHLARARPRGEREPRNVARWLIRHRQPLEPGDRATAGACYRAVLATLHRGTGMATIVAARIIDTHSRAKKRGRLRRLATRSRRPSARS
jgi:hypothetical protein